MEPYVFYFLHLKTLFWEEIHRLCQIAKGISGNKPCRNTCPQVVVALCHAAYPHFPYPATPFLPPSPPIPQVGHFLCPLPQGTTLCSQVILSHLGLSSRSPPPGDLSGLSLCHTLDHGSARLFCKGPDSKHFKLKEPFQSAISIQPCHCIVKVATDSVQMSECGCNPIHFV